MITCPRCGAVNKEGTSVCRMCATPLEAPDTLRTNDDKASSLAATVVIPGQNPPQVAAGSAGMGEIVCSKCGKTNEPDWAFCQYCGNKLTQPSLEPPKPVVNVQQPI